MSGIAGLLLAVGAAQMCALAIRDEPYPIAAAALALLLAGGGVTLAAFVRRNAAALAQEADRRSSPPDILAMAALALLAGEALYVLWATGTFFPLRMLLFWRGGVPAERLLESPLPMMLAGTCLLALGAAATAALLGALWVLLYARGLERQARAIGTVVAFSGAVPYVAVALVVRALLCQPVAFRAAGHYLALRPDEQLAYRSLFGMAPGLLVASVALGLGLGRGLWSWLDQVRAAEESSDSFLMARLRGQRAWEIVLRQGVWLRRRRDLGALFLGGMAAATLIDILSNTLVDSFRPPGFPPYPSLGAALFLRGISDGGVPAPFEPAWGIAHVAVVLASLILLLAQTFPRRSGRVALRDGALSVGSNVLARAIPTAHGLSPRPSVQWVLGSSGSGKSTLLHAWAAQLRNAVLVPQEPDDALPGCLAGLDLTRIARDAHPRGERVLWDLLGRVDDDRIRRRLFDPFTPVSAYSRGERQRLLLCLALTRARGDAGCTLLLDEPTSAQDAARTHALLDCVRDLLPAQFAGSGSLVFTSHDPESIEALLGDRGPQAVTDHVLWLEDRRAHAFSVAAPRRLEGATAQPGGLQVYLAAATGLLEARHRAPGQCEPTDGAGIEAVRLLRPRVSIGGRDHAVSPEARIREGELVVLHGPSGTGKSTLLRAMVDRRLASVAVGYVTQDLGRAFPAEMPVREVLDASRRSTFDRELLRHWFGGALDEPMMARSMDALSEGERQRVLLAGEVLRLEQAAPHTRLRLLLLDEPFGSVDPPAHLRLMQSLLAWLGGASRRAAVLVSHSPLVDLGLAHASGVPTTEWTIDGGRA
ncbi:MAG: ATP-binding cassette domain-containing protein [Myxococcales bacterium]